MPNETRLLVVNSEADKYYKSKNIVVKGTQSNVVVKTSVRETTKQATPETEKPQQQQPTPPATTRTQQPQEDNNNSPAHVHTPVQTTVTNGHSEEDKHDDTRSVSSAASSTATSEASTQPQVR